MTISRAVRTACGGAILMLGCGDVAPGSGAGESVELVRATLTYPGGWQDVEQFTTTKGVTPSFVQDHQGPVGYRNGGCSGTLIGDGLYFTVAHCIGNPDPDVIGSDGEVRNFIRFGYQLDTNDVLMPFNTYDVGQVLEDNPNPNDATVSTKPNGTTDHGLMRLVGYPENEYGFTTIDAGAPDPSQPVVLIGHPGIPAPPELGVDHTSYKTVGVPNIQCLSGTSKSGMPVEITYASGITIYGGSSGAGVLSPLTGRLIGINRSSGFNENNCSTGRGRANAIARDLGVSEFMRADRGSARLYTSTATGLERHRWQKSTWRSQWHHLVAGRFRGLPTQELLAYDSVRGEVRFFTITASGELAQGPATTGVNTPRHPWGQIVALPSPPLASPLIVFFNTLDQTYQTFYTNGAGSLTPILGAGGPLFDLPGVTPAWRLAAAGSFSEDGPQVVLYNPINGRLGLFSVDYATGRLSIRSVATGFGRWVTAVVAGDFRLASPRQEVLVYDPVRKNVRVVWFDGAGAHVVGPAAFGDRYFSQVVGGLFVGNTASLLAYEPSDSSINWYSNVSEDSATIRYYMVQAAPDVFGVENVLVTPIKSETGFRRSTSKLIAGNFLQAGSWDVLAYDRYRAVDGYLYAVQGASLLRIDSDTGAWSRAGAEDWTGATSIAALSGKLYVIQSSQLLKVEPSTGAYTRLGTAGAWSGPTQMATLGFGLFVLQGGQLLKVDDTTGAWTRIGTDTYSTPRAMAGAGGRLYVVDGGRLKRVDPLTGTMTVLGSELWPGTPRLAALGRDLYAVRTNTLLKVDTTTGTSTLVGTGNWLNATALTAFDGRLYVVQGDDLFRVDPATGVGTMLGPANAWSGDVKMTVSN
jgi:hypothetical protein